MKIAITKIIKELQGKQDFLVNKIDNIDWDSSKAFDRDERLNDAWDAIEVAIESLKEIKDI